jgi:hypothetical protein
VRFDISRKFVPRYVFFHAQRGKDNHSIDFFIKINVASGLIIGCYLTRLVTDYGLPVTGFWFLASLPKKARDAQIRSPGFCIEMSHLPIHAQIS